ncbi:hypothetical protein [Methanosarcina barkeri]|uniref:Uncharacterized protein n=1 Tax=Methanosarcina barkeri CM1 TaxID=796385 RepID=A0A0G3CCN0_METBA|nr:hypothetical protein [Methanosarcina barkeri]AKJ39769.1 hypothetical protein MCM1_2770 [Methanosarcina barkeri CM1]
MDIMLKAREFASVLQTDGVKGGKAFIENLFSDEKANMGAIFAVLSLIVMGVLMFVGLSILSGVDAATNINNTSAFYATKTNVISGINSGMSMTTVLMIVVISTAVLASLFGIFVLFQNRNQ